MVAALSAEERQFAEAVAQRTLLPPGGEDVIAEVAAIFDVRADDITGEARPSRLVDARSVIAYILVRDRGWTFEQAGTVLGRTHSTTQNLVDRIEKSLELRRLAQAIAA